MPDATTGAHKTLTQEQFRKVLGKAPEGTSASQVKSMLSDRGYDVEEPGLGQKATAIGRAALPAIGGIAGSIIGARAGPAINAALGATGLASKLTGPLASVVGAGAGGALGSEGQMLIDALSGNAAALPAGGMEALQQIAGEAGGQAAMAAGGEGLALGAKAVARPLMQVAMKTGVPQIAETAIQEGITATRRGTARLLNRLGQAGRETRGLVRNAALSGQKYDVGALLKNAYSDVFQQIEPAMDSRQIRGLRSSIMRFIGKNPDASMDPVKLHVLKQRADDLAAPIWKQIAKKEPVGPRQRAEALFYKAFADQARSTLGLTIDGYKASNAKAEQLKLLKDAILPAVKKERGLGAQVVGALTRPAAGAAVGASIGAITNPEARTKAAIMGALLGGMAGTPYGLSAGSLALDSPIVAQILKRTLQGPAALSSLSAEPY